MTLGLFSAVFLNTRILNFMKIRPVGAELFLAKGRTDGRMDMTKLIVAFRNFETAPKKTDKLRNDLSVITICSAKLYV